jgi:hypothetical protein
VCSQLGPNIAELAIPWNDWRHRRMKSSPNLPVGPFRASNNIAAEEELLVEKQP